MNSAKQGRRPNLGRDASRGPWTARLARLLAVIALLAPLGALAVQPEEQLADPALEARARELSKGLRCVVCQNQTIDESEASLARDMRVIVRKRLLAGDTDEEILQRLETSYGEYIHMRPRFTLANALLWAAGPLALLIGVGVYLQRVRAAPAGPEPDAAPAAPPPPPSELTPEEQARLKRLLED
ncbi:MAG: cytochrome c-type biogenesis protein [Pseudomonadota bacterium]